MRRPTSVEPVNAILSTPGCATSAAPVSPCAGDDVDDAGWEVGVADQLGQLERRERRCLRGLEHDCVAAGERWSDLPRRHEQGKVPGNDLARDAEGAGPPARERVVELVGPARVVEEMRGRERHVDVA
jgi:hypothetical protein